MENTVVYEDYIDAKNYIIINDQKFVDAKKYKNINEDSF